MGGEGTCQDAKKGKGRQPTSGELSTRYHYGQLKLNPTGGVMGVCVKQTQEMGKGAGRCVHELL